MSHTDAWKSLVRETICHREPFVLTKPNDASSFEVDVDHTLLSTSRQTHTHVGSSQMMLQVAGDFQQIGG